LSAEKNICVICAWREHCQKRFSLPAGANCQDYTRDVTIKEKPGETKDNDAGERDS
jgi:hypothetical protein